MSGFVTIRPCTRAEADALAATDDPFPGIDPPPSLVASETPRGWELRLYTAEAPGRELLAMLAGHTPSAGEGITIEPLASTDWVVLSEQGLEPVDVGRFHLFARCNPGTPRPGQWPLAIEAGLAFGTGRHATTASCLRVAQQLARRHRPRRILDVGTGSGILALAALRLHPGATAIATDLDARAIAVARKNARANGFVMGRGRGRIRLIVAGGLRDRRIHADGPHDLVLANILAGPLVALAPSLSATVARGGRLVLAGLLQPQARAVIAAYCARGFRLIARDPQAEWPVLVLERTRPASRLAGIRAARRETAGRGWAADSI